MKEEVPHEPVTGLQTGMLGVPDKFHAKKRAFGAGQMEIGSYQKYQEAMKGGEMELKEGTIVRLKSGTEGWIKGRIAAYAELKTFPPLHAAIVTGPSYDVYIMEGKHKGETLRVPANYVEPLDEIGDLHWFTVNELQFLCGECGQETAGNKEALINRLKKVDKERLKAKIKEMKAIPPIPTLEQVQRGLRRQIRGK